MADNIHPAVELLAARMESHPEEFQLHANSSLAITGRWETWIAQVGWYLNEAERELIYGKAKEVIFQRIHEEVLDELLNGEQRRAEEQAAYDAEVQRLMAQSQTNAQSLYQSQVGAYQNAIGIGTHSPSQSLVINTAGQEAMRITANGELNIGGETLDAGMLKKMKSALGLK
jgi:hypothetical protein